MSLKTGRIITTACCTLQLMCTIGLCINSLTIFMPYLIANGTLTNTQSSAIGTVRLVASFFAMFPLEGYLRRVGLRRGMLLSLLIAGAGVLAFSQAKSFLMCCAAAVVIGIAYSLGGMVTVSVLLNTWFDSHLSAAIGICTSGTGLALIIAPPIITRVIEGVSVSAGFMTIVGFVGVTFLLELVFLRERAPYTAADKKQAAAAPAAPEQGEIMLFTVLIGALSYPAYQHLSVLFSEAGYSGVTISHLLSVYGIALTIAKCACGVLTEAFGSRRMLIFIQGTLTVGLAGCCLAGYIGAVGTGVLMVVIAFGLVTATVGFPILALAFAPHGGYDSLLRRMQTVYLISGMFFNILPGFVADLTGSYIPAYVGLTVLAFISVVVVWHLFGRLRKREDAEIQGK
jgi:predicted MFS family arabinose efflux permease